MKILFYIPPGGRSLPMPNYGLSVVATSLLNDAEVEVLDRASETAPFTEGYSIEVSPSPTPSTDAESAAAADYDYVALQIHSGNLLAGAVFLENLRKLNPRTTIIVGGPSTNTVYQTFSRRRLADYFFFGDASLSLSELLRSGGRRLPPNALRPGYLGDKGPYQRSTHQWVSPDYRSLYRRSFDILPFLCTTGCVFNCAFCTSRRELVGFEVREQSQDELKSLIVANSPRLIRFNDSSFNGHRPTFLRTINTLIELRENLAWGGYLSLAALRRDDIPKMAESGCAYVYLGIESGDEAIRTSQRKHFKNSAALELVNLLREAGISVLVSLIVGLPGDTVDKVARTTDTVLSLQPTATHVFAYEERADLVSLGAEECYWRALLGRTTHKILAPQHRNPTMLWPQTLALVEDLKRTFKSAGVFSNESALADCVLQRRRLKVA